MKYHRRVFTRAILNDLREIFEDICKKMQCTLAEFDEEKDHVHLMKGKNEIFVLYILAMNSWVFRHIKIKRGILSVEAAKKIEEATEGKVSKEELLFPNDVQNEDNNE